jgi:hypothetical protein
LEIVLFVDELDVFLVFFLLSGCRNNSFQSEIISLHGGAKDTAHRLNSGLEWISDVEYACCGDQTLSFLGTDHRRPATIDLSATRGRSSCLHPRKANFAKKAVWPPALFNLSSSRHCWTKKNSRALPHSPIFNKRQINSTVAKPILSKVQPREGHPIARPCHTTLTTKGRAPRRATASQ